MEHESKAGEGRIVTLSTLGEPIPKREWSYKTAREELVNHPSYAMPVVKKQMGTVFVKEYEKTIFWGLLTLVKTKTETVWDSDYIIHELGVKNV